jgi:DNA gyrase subunit A
MLITKQGVIIRSPVSQVRVTGRVAQGVKLVQLDDKDLVTAVARVVPEEKDENEDGIDGGDGVVEAEDAELLDEE